MERRTFFVRALMAIAAVCAFKIPGEAEEALAYAPAPEDLDSIITWSPPIFTTTLGASVLPYRIALMYRAVGSDEIKFAAWGGCMAPDGDLSQVRANLRANIAQDHGPGWVNTWKGRKRIQWAQWMQSQGALAR